MSKRHSFDLSVYFIADPSLCGGRDVAQVVEAAVKGGATMIQYRDKHSTPSQVLRNAKLIKEVAESFQVPFIVNDYMDVALETGADGVHLGQDDMSLEEARRVLGDEAIIGITAFEEVHFAAIDPGLVDYAGVGPFYPTQTDKGKPVLGPERFEELANLSPVPVVGIGGITPENALAVMEAGADGVAMMRSVSEAEDPARAAEQFLNVVAASRLRDVS